MVMNQLSMLDKNGSVTQEALARQLRDDGMQRAADHAEAVEPTWNERAMEYTKLYARENRQLRCEMVRIFAENDGFSKPPDKRAWGAVMMRAAKAGILTKLCWTTASDPRVHKNPVSLWQSNIFEGRP